MLRSWLRLRNFHQHYESVEAGEPEGGWFCGRPAVGASGDRGLEVGAEGAEGAADSTVDEDQVAAEGTDAGVEGEEMGSVLGVVGEAG